MLTTESLFVSSVLNKVDGVTLKRRGLLRRQCLTMVCPETKRLRAHFIYDVK